MREYGQVQCAYWRDPDIRGLSQDAQYLGVYLLTGPHSNGLGCYYLPDGYLVADLRWDGERVSKAFGELSSIEFCKRCQATDFVLIPKFLRWNEIANANVAKARIKEFDTVPRKSSVFRDLCISLERFGNHWPNDFKNVLEGFLKPYTEQEPNRTEPESTQNLNQTVPPAIAGGAKPDGSACPHQQIIALYHTHLPMGREVKTNLWNGTRAKHLQARWREDKQRQSIEWWENFFAYCAKSPFLTGQVTPRQGRTPFQVSLDWIVEPGNFVKIIEGAYER